MYRSDTKYSMQTDKRKLTCIIVDDETSSHKNLKFRIARVDWLELIGKYYNAFDTMDAIRNLKPDIVFLDVTMPLMTGPEMLGHLPSADFIVILITANPRHETDLKDARIKAFINKPVFTTNFMKAIEAFRPN